VCVQNKLLEKEKTNNRDNTHTDIFFANDYKATKTRAFENTLIWNMHGIIHTNRKKKQRQLLRIGLILKHTHQLIIGFLFNPTTWIFTYNKFSYFIINKNC